LSQPFEAPGRAAPIEPDEDDLLVGNQVGERAMRTVGLATAVGIGSLIASGVPCVVWVLPVFAYAVVSIGPMIGGAVAVAGAGMAVNTVMGSGQEPGVRAVLHKRMPMVVGLAAVAIATGLVGALIGLTSVVLMTPGSALR